MRHVWVLLLLSAALPAGDDAEPAGNRLDDRNKKAAAHVARTFAQQGRLLSTQFKGLTKEDVIVVGGLFDFVQELLVAFRVPHTVITPAELERVPMKRPERMVFLLNCHLLDRRFPKSQPSRARAKPADAARNLERVLKEAGLGGERGPGKAIRDRFAEVAQFAGSDYSIAGLKRMGDAVRKGGAWIFSSDWAIVAIEKALPGTIRWTGHSTCEETVEVYPSLVGKRHPLLKGVFPNRKARWWLETEAYLFRAKGRYKVLIESRQLGARYSGNRNVVVLVEPGKGRVLHALTHHYLQRGKTDDAAAMQTLLVNYLIEKSLANWKREFAAKPR